MKLHVFFLNENIEYSISNIFYKQVRDITQNSYNLFKEIRQWIDQMLRLMNNQNI